MITTISTNRTTALLLEADSWFKASKDEIAEIRQKNDGKIVMKTLLQRADRKNQMGRIYPELILMREFKAYQDYVDDRSAHGESDHPSDPVVSLNNTSHIITKQWYQKNERNEWEWWGDLELLNTTAGKNIQALVEDGVKFGISSRGVGSTKFDKARDADVVQEDFTIIAFDIVSHPSTHAAIPVLKEGIDINQMEKHIAQRYLQNRIDMLVQEDFENKYNHLTIIGQ